MYRLFIVATHGDFVKIVGFSLGCKQNLLVESHVLKQIEDVSCRHSGVLAGIHFCASQDLNNIVLKQLVYKKYLKFEIKVAIFGSTFLIFETATADLLLQNNYTRYIVYTSRLSYNCGKLFPVSRNLKYNYVDILFYVYALCVV